MRFAKYHVIGGVLKSGRSIVGFVPLNEQAHNLTGSTQRRAQGHERQQRKRTGIVRVTDSGLPVPEHRRSHAVRQHNILLSLQLILSEALEVVRVLVEVSSPVIREGLGLLASQSFTEIIQALAVYVLLFPHVMKQPVSHLKRLEHGDLHSLFGIQNEFLGLDRALTPDKTVNLQPRAQDAGDEQHLIHFIEFEEPLTERRIRLRGILSPLNDLIGCLRILIGTDRGCQGGKEHDRYHSTSQVEAIHAHHPTLSSSTVIPQTGSITILEDYRADSKRVKFLLQRCTTYS